MTSLLQPSSTSLLSLPDELLLHILQDSPTIGKDEFFALTRTCHRLHAIALPLFLSVYGLSGPYDTVKIELEPGPNIDALSALLVDFDLTSLKSLSCTFVSHPSPCDTRHLFPPLRRLAALLERLESVDLVDICLESNMDFSGVAGSDALLEEWTTTFGRLMNLIVERSCSELVVRNGLFLTESYALKRLSFRQALAARLKRARKGFFGFTQPSALHGDRWEYYRSPEQGDRTILMNLSARARAMRHLESLDIRSMTLLLPPCSHWLLDLLKHTPLTHLKFSNITVSYGIWSAILPSIARCLQPRLLTRLSVNQCRTIEITTLFAFLRRFHNLTHLSLDNSALRIPHRLRIPIPKLENLEYLRAPGRHVLTFLRTSGLPSLRSIHILTMDLSVEFSAHTDAPQIRSLLASLRHCPDITFDFTRHISSAWTMRRDVDAAVEDTARSFEGITHIVVNAFQILKDNMMVFCRWLALFPTLERVTMGLSLRAVRQWKDVQMKIPELVETSKIHSPGVRVFVIKGISFEVYSEESEGVVESS